MKIAFAANGNTWSDKLESRFGRAKGFAVYDDNSQELDWHSNDNLNDSHGVGIQVGQLMSSLGVEMIATGGPVGPKAADVLKQSGIQMRENLGNISIKDALEIIKKG